MFLQSLLGGWAVLASWKIWVAMCAYIYLSSRTLGLGRFGGGKAESGSAASPMGGAVLLMIVRLLLQGVLMSLFVAVMLPVMLGTPSVTPLSGLLASSWPITKAGVIATLAFAILCLTPAVGRVIASSICMQTFMMGAMFFRLFFPHIEHGPLQGHHAIYPSLWYCLCYLVINAALAWILTLLGFLVGKKLARMGYDPTGVVILSPLFEILGGFTALFMYVQYVKLAVRAAF
jgi:hypothetical protein